MIFHKTPLLALFASAIIISPTSISFNKEHKDEQTKMAGAEEREEFVQFLAETSFFGPEFTDV